MFGTNSKTSKGDSEKELTAIMYLAPADISGYNVCPKASEGCKTSCLFTAGRGAMNSVMQARIRKTKLFFENQKEFLNLLTNDLNLFNQYCIDNNFTGYVRLNGTSDITWESYDIIQKYPNLKFYDYTKIYNRDISNLKNFNKPNYELDKDLYFLINKNIPKVYSKDTCYFLPKPINLVLRSFPTKSLQTKLKLKNLINIFKNDLDTNVVDMLEELTK